MKPKFRSFLPSRNNCRLGLLSNTLSLGLAVVGMCAQSAHAAGPYYWDENAATAGFGTAGTVGTNWSSTTSLFSTDATGVTNPTGTQATTSADAINFGATNLGLGSGTVGVSGTVSAASIDFRAGNGTVTIGTVGTGGTIQLSGTVANAVVSNTQTINADIDLMAATRAFGNTVSTGVMVLGGSISTSSGTAGLTINRQGAVTLSGTNTFNGNVTIGGTNSQSPTLIVSSMANNLGSSGSSVIFTGGTGSPTSTLRYTGIGETSNRSFSFSGATNTVTGAIENNNTAGTLILSGSISNSTTANRTLNIRGSGTGQISGAITNGSTGLLSLDKRDGGTWTLSGGSNTFTGSTTVTTGTLASIGASAFGNTSGISIAGAGILSLRGDANTAFVKSSDGTTKYAVTTSANGATINATSATGVTTAKTMFIGTLTTNTAGDNNTNFTGSDNTSLDVGAVNTGTSGTTGTETFTNSISDTGTLNLLSVTINRTVATTLKFDGTGSTIVSGSITQNAALATALNKSGSGTLTLSGSNNYAGTTTVSGGTILLGNASALGAGSAINLGATSSGSGANMTSLLTNGAFAITGGTITVNGGGGPRILGSNSATSSSFANNITVTTGAFQVSQVSGGTLTLSGNMTPDTTGRAVTFTNTGNVAVTGNITGSLSVTQSGSGTTTLSGTNTYTAGTTVKNGTLVLGSGGSLSTSNTLVLGDATSNTSGAFQLGDSAAPRNTTVASLTTAGTGTANAVVGGNASNSTLTVNNNSAVSYGGLLGGAGTHQNNLALSKSGAGTLTLSVANTYTGGTASTGGAIAITNGSALGSGALSFTDNSGGIGKLQVSNNITVANVININGSAAGSATSGVIESTGNNALNGNITWNVTGGGNASIASQSGTLTLGGNITAATITGSRTFNLGGAGDVSASGVISNGSATVALAKDGVGTLTLSGTNTYTGTTAVQLGKLVVSGFIGNSAVTVTGTNTTLASGTTGTIGSSVTVNSGAILAAGDVNAIGTATVTNGTAFNSASIFSWDLNASGDGTVHDIVNTTSVTGDNTAIFRIVLGTAQSFAEDFWNTSHSWSNVFTGSGSSLASVFGTRFEYQDTNGTTGPSVGSFTFNGSTLEYNFSAVPEPTSAIAGLLLGAGLLRRRRA